MFDYLYSARQGLCARRNEAAEPRSTSPSPEPIKPPRQTDYASGGVYDPVFAGLFDAASIRAVICSHTNVRPRAERR